MKDKLIELIKSRRDPCDIGACPFVVDDVRPCSLCEAESLAEHLIANDVTFADDNNVGNKWIPVSERLPEPFVSVLVQMPDEEPCPTVHEGFLTKNGTWYAAHFEREPSEVTHWMPMPEFTEGK